MTFYQLFIDYLGMGAAFFKGNLNISFVKKYACVLQIDLIAIMLFMNTSVV